MFLDLKANGDDIPMVDKKRALIDEQTSPLQRIMWVYNNDEPQKRTFENNICTFHIGNGYFLSVAHNLRLQSGYYRSIEDDIYRRDLLPILDGSQTRFLDQQYFTDEYTKKRYLNTTDPESLKTITNILKQKRFDTRWVTLAQKKICRPYLVFQFRNNAFYNDADLTREFDANRMMYDQAAHRHTFFVEVELVEAFYGADIALYKVVGASKDLISKIPSVEVNFDFLDESVNTMYCLQSSPSGPTGRLLNTAHIEGMLDHFGIFPDDVGGNYIFEGCRYLMKGYFRFGSSGAPYVFYDEVKGRYVVNAIQSEASGVQLSIKNDREGNFQYINAIASPLSIIKDELEKHLRH
ncbi:MAG: hypothetical protein JWQ38_1074 [Flavipsychrobacter sp.]|nr:hypothetical protein [Flavipsychrobacter sp.]